FIWAAKYRKCPNALLPISPIISATGAEGLRSL
ncbi:MAG: hypothetical protein ACI87H_001142, partial [Gammaproteobacteria bacterium]